MQYFQRLLQSNGGTGEAFESIVGILASYYYDLLVRHSAELPPS